MSRAIRKLLVANRGEIAIRIMRTARHLGIRTVAVFSEADENQAFVQFADEARCIGGPAPSDSYLNIPNVLSAAQALDVDAIHPGYGFLSERAEFADAVVHAGMIFVGPSSDAMRRLGSKIEAKQLAVQAGVPICPGYFELGATDDQLEDAAIAMGYPVMLKASAGGGGRGMRVVRDPSEFRTELRLASEEALKAFGDGAMMVEKLIEKPRHVEVQVIADHHGNVAALFERECSIQRRHQKLLEEAPAPVMDILGAQHLWPKMAEASRRLVQVADYTNAGTVEFMVDDNSGEFYFLEVNARLQVEHPVTEAVTGLDLVQLQLEIAQGSPLNIPEDLLSGERTGLNGHAIEARIIAEDPGSGFMPSVGEIVAWAEPTGPGIRVDTGYRKGVTISRYYDSLIAKLVVHGPTRADALRRMREALLDFHILGVKTNIAYLLDVIGHAEFVNGRFDTGFLGREFAEWTQNVSLPPEMGDLLKAGQAQGAVASAATMDMTPAWSRADSFRVTQ